MLQQSSFSQVLNEILEEDISPSTDYSAGWESHMDPFNLAQLMGDLQINPSKTAKPVSKAYPFKAKLRVRQAHALSPEQGLAFTEIKRHSQHLPADFNLRELKSAYRQSVLKTHPDMGGNSESFQLIKKSYHILEALVKNEA